MTERSIWTIHGERLVDDTPHLKLSIAAVELPNGVEFEQYVLRIRRCAMTVVLDDAAENVLSWFGTTADPVRVDGLRAASRAGSRNRR